MMTTTFPSVLEDFLTFCSQYNEQTFMHRSGPWRFRRSGLGKDTIVMLPGALGTGDVFYRTVMGLSDRLDCCTVSLPTCDNLEDVLDGLEELINQLGTGPVYLLGSSLGGYVAQAFTHRHPELVKKLILSSTFSNPVEQQSKWPEVERVRAQSAEEILGRAREQLLNSVPASPPARELQQILLTLVGDAQTAEQVKSCRLLVLLAETLAAVPLAANQVIIIDDDDDPVIAPGTRSHLRHLYSESLQIKIDGGGHYPSVLTPQAYIAAVAQALDAP